MFGRSWLWRASLLLLGVAPGVAGEITVALGENLQRVIDRSAPEAELVLAEGVHYAQRLRLRSGDVLRGAPGAKLIGSLLLSGVSDVEVRNLRLESRAGDCIQVRDSDSIRIRASEIGPCNGNGLDVRDSRVVLVTDNYIHPEHPVTRCCDTGDGLYVLDSQQIRVAGNVVAFGETNIELHGVEGGEIVGNYLLNPLGPYPRGQQVQAYFGSHDVKIEGNYLKADRTSGYAFSEHQEDAVNAGQSTDIAVTDNFITGGSSPSGCGVIADEGAHEMSIVDNVLWATGQCGIGVASGRDHHIIGNRIRNTFVAHPGAGNTAIYVWRQYSGDCGPVRVSGNTAFARKPTGEFSSFWVGDPSCEPVTLSHNIFGQRALESLPDALLESLRPLIPPQPQNCVAPSPFANNPARSCLAGERDEAESPPPIRSRTHMGQSP